MSVLLCVLLTLAVAVALLQALARVLQVLLLQVVLVSPALVAQVQGAMLPLVLQPHAQDLFFPQHHHS